MTDINYLPRQAQVLERLFGYRAPCESRRVPQTPEDHFTIALSHEAGTPALEIAKEVAARLGWSVYDRELPARIALELNMPVTRVEAIDERRQSWLLECIESFVSTPHLCESRYLRCLVAIIHSLGTRGRGVIVGHGAAFILPRQSTVRVHLVGDREDRIAAFGRRLHLDHPTAARRVEEISEERRRFIREHFHAEPGKARHYDLVLNTSQWSPADCADFIVQALQQKATGHLKG